MDQRRSVRGSSEGQGDGVRGSSALEITVAIAVVLALAAVVVPAGMSTQRKDRLSEVLDLVDTLRGASLRFHEDLGTCAREYGSSEMEDNHQLSMPQAEMKRWAGPYLPRPLGPESSPFGGFVNLYSGLDHSIFSGFDLEGRGQRADGGGAFVRFSECPETYAHMIDQALDRGIPGSWTRSGRVQWRDGRLDIFLHQVGR